MSGRNRSRGRGRCGAARSYRSTRPSSLHLGCDRGIAVVVDRIAVLVIEKIEIRGEIRSGEVAPADNDVGENSPDLLPRATVVDISGIHAYLLAVHHHRRDHILDD